MRKFTAKAFQKWRKGESISDLQFLQAIENLEDGLSSVNLGGGLFKVRVAKG